MPLPDNTLVDLVRYSKWASARLLTFAQSVPEEHVNKTIPNSHGGILKTFQHIYYADRIWTGRVVQAPGPFEDPAPGPSLADMDRVWWPLLDELAAYVESHTPETEVSFKRLNGDAHTLQLQPIVLHVVNHATYHRGQVASMLRQCGQIPPSTDLLYYHLGL